MEKILEKLEAKFDEQIKSFEVSPLKTGIKWLIIIYVLRKIWAWVKEN